MSWQYGKLFRTAEEFINWVKPILTATITEVHVHHTWEPSHDDWRARPDYLYWQNSMRSYHLSKGWSDIAQHVTIFPDGSIVTGRDINTPPASSTGYNDSDADGQHPFMFEMLGNFDTGHDKLEGKQLESAVKLTRYFSGGDEKKIRFHREMNPAKTCPGSGVDKAWFIGLVKSTSAPASSAPSASQVQAYDPNPEFHRNLSYQIPMMAGADVKRLQARLEIEVDGIFGPKTRDAVINWQKAHGLTADGIVGPVTWNALFPPMYRVTVDGVVKLDTAYEDKIAALVTEAVKNKAKVIHIEQQ